MTAGPLTQIGKYRILELVGEGAMGIVYRAEDSVLNRVVAVKVMNESIARQGDLRDRFLKEAQAAGSLSHPNVVTVYDFGEMDGHLYIAMEYVPGVDLETILAKRQQLKLSAKLDIVIDTLNALSYAHKRGIVHRDVKPANIRVTEEGRAKLMDFGVAHLSNSTATRTGESMGTPSYMAPEQATGQKVTAAADIFSIGTVLYELLTGSKPFTGSTVHSVLYQIVTEQPTPIAELVPGIPVSLEEILSRAHAKEVADRYSDALDMAADLTTVRAGLSGPNGPGTLSLRAPISATSATGRTGANAAVATADVSGAVVTASGWSRGHVMALVGSVVVGVAVVGGTYFALRRDATAMPVPVQTATQASALQPNAPTSEAGAPNDVSTPAPTPNAPATDSRPDVRSTAVVPNAKPSAPAGAAAPNPVASHATSATPNAPAFTPTTSVASAAQSAPTSTQTAAPAPSASPVASAPTASAPAAPDPAAIPEIVAAYARAISSRDLGAVRRAYPGITSAQEKNFSAFFDATRSLQVAFSVANVEANGADAEAQLTGTYDFVTSNGKNQKQPVSFHASLHFDAGRWRLTSVR